MDETPLKAGHKQQGEAADGVLLAPLRRPGRNRLPRELPSAGAPGQPRPPDAFHLAGQPAESFAVARDAEIGIVALQQLTQPRPLFCQRAMAIEFTVQRYRPQCPGVSLLKRES